MVDSKLNKGDKVSIRLQQKIPVRILFGKEVEHEPFWTEATFIEYTDAGILVNLKWHNGSLLNPGMKTFQLEVANGQFEII